MSEKDKCLTCKFFRENKGVPNGGLCMRNPPQIAWGQNEKGQLVPAGSGYPPTMMAGWCGEFVQGPLVKGVARLPPDTLEFPNNN